MRYYYLTQVKTPSLKSPQVTNTDEAVEKMELSNTVGRSADWCSHYGELCGGSSKN